MTATSLPPVERERRPLLGLLGRSVLLGLVLALAACGTSGVAASRSTTVTTPRDTTPTAASLLRQAERQVEAGLSAHVSGTSPSAEAPATVDLAGRFDGTNQRLRVTLADTDATVLTVDGAAHLLGDGVRSARAGDPSAASLLGLALPQLDRGRAQVLAGLTVGGLLRGVLDDPGVAGLGDGVVARTTVDGRAAYVLSEQGQAARVVVAADGSGHLLRATGLRGPVRDLVVDQWDVVEPFVAPAPSKVIDPPAN